MSDLETRIRDALRADEIGWDDLRQTTLRTASHLPRRWPTLLATAAAVAVVATVASLIAVTRGDGRPAAAAPYAGYTWQVTAVTDRLGQVPDAGSVPAQIAFSDTAVSGTVAGASIFGHYQATSHGYEVSDVGFASGGLIAGEKKQRIGTALLHMFLTPTGGATDLSHGAAVAARVNGDHLVLQANRVTLRLSRVGPSRLSPMIDAIGYSWRVEALTDKGGRLTIPHRLHATLGFDRYGLLVAKDPVNTLNAVVRLSNDGYTVGHTVTSTTAGYAGHDPTVIRLWKALYAMVSRNAAVTATVDGDTLTLNRRAITLTLHRGSAMPDQIATSSGSASGGATSAPPTSAMTAPRPSARSSAPNSAVRHARGAAGSPR